MSRLIKSNLLVVGNPVEIEEQLIPDECTTQGQNMSQSINADCLHTAEKINEQLDKAKAEAQSIIDRAHSQEKKIHEEAYRNGYREGLDKGKKDGFEQGCQQGQDTVNGIMQQALDIRQKAVELKESTIKDAEKDIIGLVLDIAKKVLGQQAATDNQTVLGPVRTALEKCSRLTNVVMRVTPEDYDTVVRLKAGLLVEAQSVSDIEIIPDKTLKPGSCIVETEAGSIDTGLDTQLGRIEKAFREMLGYE